MFIIYLKRSKRKQTSIGEKMKGARVSPGSPGSPTSSTGYPSTLPVIAMTPVQSASCQTIPTNTSANEADIVYTDREGVGDQENEPKISIDGNDTKNIQSPYLAFNTPSEDNNQINNHEARLHLRKESTLDPEMEKMYQIQPQKPPMDTPGMDGNINNEQQHRNAQGNILPTLPKFDNNWGYEDNAAGGADDYEHYEEYGSI